MSVYPSSGRSNLRVLGLCLGLTFAMLGMAYAAVPLYAWFCQVTGYAGTTQRADADSGVVLDKTINVRFDSNVSGGLNWHFAPAKRMVTLRIGETSQVHYVARNIGKETSFGTATFNVSPGVAGAYFNKLECFCFTEQELASGEQVDMPVVFYVDPEIANDPLLKDTKTITLSYTFFPDDDAQAEHEVSESVPVGEGGEKPKSSL